MTIVLRPYQREAIADLQQRFAAGHKRVPMVLATGLGKGSIFTAPSLLEPYLAAGKRVLIIVHTEELTDKAVKEARLQNPGRRVGIVKAALNQVTAEIIVSTRQTLGSERRRAGIRNVGLIIIDEAHFAHAGNTYGRIVEHFEAAGQVDVCGFTATFARSDRNKLSSLWNVDRHPFTRDIIFGIRHGYLLDVQGERLIVPDMDLSRVKRSGGDFQDSSLGEEMLRAFAPEVIAEQFAASEAVGQRLGMVFWPLVDTAYSGAKAFEAAGVTSAVVHGTMPKPERRAILRAFHNREIQTVHNAMVLTAGYDEPRADIAVIARPTKSAPLFQQIAGRVLRPDLEIPAEQRRKALLMLVSDATGHDLRQLVDLAPERALNRDAGDDGESLLEISEAYDIEQEAPDAAPDVYKGPAVTIAWDPLARDRLWGKTPGGVWHMSAGTVAYVFLVDSVAGEPGRYDVVLTSKPGRGVKAWTKATDYVDLPLDVALAEAEGLALEVGGHGTKTLTGRKSAWRRKPATECKPGFIGIGRSLGVYVDGMTAGELSEAIDAAQAAARIDPIVSRVRQLTSE